MSSARILVAGAGSIGKRHFANLSALGVRSLAVVDPALAQQSPESFPSAAEVFFSYSDALDWQPDAVVIATPNHLHVQQAVEAAERHIHLFVEKPLSHTTENLELLLDLVNRNRLISLVGCNMRFHPGPAQVKRLLDSGVIGKVLFARIYTGSYLPEWHPQRDYRASYSALESTGGGCVLDCIHEIDLASWYLGPIQHLFCMSDRLDLEIETEDYASLVCRHDNGARSEIHLDYLERAYSRGCYVAGRNGSIVWDVSRDQVSLFETQTRSWSHFPYPASWQLNQMYLDEMQHFLDCLHSGTPSVFPVSHAVQVLRTALAARRSARTGALVTC